MSDAVSLPGETLEKVFQVGALDVVSTGTNRIDRFLSVLPKRNGSDLHLAVGSPPVLRIDGDLERVRYRALTEGDFYNLVGPVTPPRIWAVYGESGDVDFAYQMGSEARFRVNLFRQERGSAAVFRLIPARVPTAEELDLPAAVVGPVRRGPGAHPRHGPDRQREVDDARGDPRPRQPAPAPARRDDRGPHRVRAHERQVDLHAARDRAGRAQLRGGREGRDPGGPRLPLVGEMRDLETMRMALTAAETGLLVFATLHTNSAAKAVDRIIDAFPASEQEQIRIVLAETLRAVVAQQLLKKSGSGRIPAFEILLGSSALSNAIREGKRPRSTTRSRRGVPAEWSRWISRWRSSSGRDTSKTNLNQ